MREKKLPLIISAKRLPARIQDAHAGEADEKFQEVRVPVLERDRYTCRGCGLTAEKYQEVHHLDDDHQNNDPKNLATACPLCHQYPHAGLAGLHRGATLVHLPQIAADDLNLLGLVLMVAIEQGVYADKAKHIMSMLHGLGLEVEQTIGEGASNPAMLANALLDLSDEDYAKRDQILDGMRLMPKPDRFPAQIQYWAKELFKGLPPESWSRIHERMEQSFPRAVIEPLNEEEIGADEIAEQSEDDDERA